MHWGEWYPLPRSLPETIKDSENTHASAKIGYSSVDSSTVGTLTVAAAMTFAGMLIYTRRDAERRLENAGGNSAFGAARDEPDAQEIESNNFLAKLSWLPSEGHELTLSVDYLENETEYKHFSTRGRPCVE